MLLLYVRKKTMSMFETLSNSPLFKGILPVEIEKLLGQVRTQVKRYKKGNTVAFRGDKCSVPLT